MQNIQNFVKNMFAAFGAIAIVLVWLLLALLPTIVVIHFVAKYW